MKKLYVCYVEQDVDYYGFISGNDVLHTSHSFNRATRMTREQMDKVDRALEASGIIHRHWFEV